MPLALRHRPFSRLFLWFPRANALNLNTAAANAADAPVGALFAGMKVDRNGLPKILDVDRGERQNGTEADES